jgi:hypothetical protein
VGPFNCGQVASFVLKDTAHRAARQILPLIVSLKNSRLRIQPVHRFDPQPGVEASVLPGFAVDAGKAVIVADPEEAAAILIYRIDTVSIQAVGIMTRIRERGPVRLRPAHPTDLRFSAANLIRHDSESELTQPVESLHLCSSRNRREVDKNCETIQVSASANNQLRLA